MLTNFIQLIFYVEIHVKFDSDNFYMEIYVKFGFRQELMQKYRENVILDKQRLGKCTLFSYFQLEIMEKFTGNCITSQLIG